MKRFWQELYHQELNQVYTMSDSFDADEQAEIKYTYTLSLQNDQKYKEIFHIIMGHFHSL